MLKHCLAVVGIVVVLDLPSMGSTTTLSFDDVTSLDEYAPLGVTFSPEISLWVPRDDTSVLDDPSGGPVTVPNGICAGPCGGGVVGSIFFDAPQSFIAIYALSGPGTDNISPGTVIRAYDASGVLLDERAANTSVQFDVVTLCASGIRRVDIESPDTDDEAWDELTFSDQDLTLMIAPRVTTPGNAIHLDLAEGTPGDLSLIAVENVGGVPTFAVILSGSYDAHGQLGLLAPSVPGLGGLNVTFRGYGFSKSGALVSTDPRTVVFQ